MGPYLTLDLENSWTFAKNMLNHESELYARALALPKIILSYFGSNFQVLEVVLFGY